MENYVVANLTSTPALSAEGGGRDIAIDHDGKLWVVYSKKPAGINYHQIYAAFSSDNGQTWAEERVSFGYDNKHHFFPAIAVDAFNNLHIVYTSTGRAPFATRWGTFYRMRGLGGWEAEETVALLDVANPGQDYPAIAVGVADTVHVVWAGLGWGTHPTIKNIQYRAKIGGSWGNVEQVTDMPGIQDCPSIAIDSFGAVHVAWHGVGWGTNAGFKQVAYGHGPAAWITENVTDTPTNNYQSRIALDSGDSPHVVYYDANADVIFYAKRAGVIWGNTEQVSQPDASLYGYPSIALDRDNNIHVAWTGLGQGLSEDYGNLWYRKKSGVTWLEIKNITASESNDQQSVSLLWASYPEVGGIKSNVLPNYALMVWEAMGEAILFARSPEYARPASRSQGHIIS
ncbi:MAG: hypothetical protein PHU08_03270 [Dehalococcoidales bacterium]|nr:hypothetical protein [Dehalococcoidales bacterium]